MGDYTRAVNHGAAILRLRGRLEESGISAGGSALQLGWLARRRF